MKTILIVLAVTALVQASGWTTTPKKKRGSYDMNYGFGHDISFQPSSWGSGIDKFLPLQQINSPDYNLKVNLASTPHIMHVLTSNALGNDEKPVQEAQDFVPPQSIGTAFLPQMLPPATPVNAVASNIPTNGGAVFLGSGSIGVVNLGNGAYALGSGSLGYSENRSNPRPTATSPLYPPVVASPNLIPAAVPTSAPISPILPLGSNGLDFFTNTNNYNNQGPPIINANGYEYLAPNRVGFGNPIPRLPRLRTVQQFATATTLQLQPRPSPQPQLQFSNLEVPQLPSASYQYSIGQSQAALPSFG